MSKNIRERRRQVNVDALSPEDAERIGFELGKKAGEIGDKAAVEINKLTNIYGIKAKVAIQFYKEKTGELIT